MKRLAPLAGLVAGALLGGCAVYPDGTPMYSNGYGGYESYDGYAPGVAVVPQTNVYMGYSNDPGPGYYNGPGRYYGPGPGYRGYPDRDRPNDNGGNHGDHGNRGGNGGGPGPHGGPPPQGAVAGPHGPGGSSGPRPGAGGPPPAQQAGNGGGRGNTWGRTAPARQPGQMTEH
ncbi:hypothetical protein [Paraburkholderia susongensis]|uniref:Uncharacterized protein n=1 Tax=Paraburkholderia susongensis TaxID=1515439 RepID=A0A1X7IA38_9BURK|nr:hypothetical protein [Paraburkholderia susongensis]SMG10816.1 hypothetical protein SAMN06265784_101438 [Paraburkholderia susongensis]